MRFLRLIKAGLIWLLPPMILAVTGLIFLEHDLEASSVFLVSFAFLLFVRKPLGWLLAKLGVSPLSPSTKRQVNFGGALFLGIVFLIGVIESFPEYFLLTVLCTQLAVFSPVGTWYFQQLGGWKGLKNTSRKKKWKLAIWSLVIAVVLLLLALSAYEFEPVVGILATSYFLGLGFLALRWLIRQIRGLLVLRKEKTTAELLHLRSQVNPHFFFNMLNNLYGTVGQDSAKAQQLILKLSDLMRYGIYEGQKESVPLMSEISYLENYVDLHRLRYHKEIDVDFRYELADENRLVMPLLFIILLENAFKHGVENLRKNAFVSVRMWTTPDAINFRVKNNFDAEARSKSPGIGLENLRRRLVLAYPDRHTYKVEETKDTYTAELTLKA